MEENKEILLPSKKYANAPDQELDLRINLETSESLLRIGDRDIVLDVAELFNKERNERKESPMEIRSGEVIYLSGIALGDHDVGFVVPKITKSSSHPLNGINDGKMCEIVPCCLECCWNG